MDVAVGRSVRALPVRMVSELVSSELLARSLRRHVTSAGVEERGRQGERGFGATVEGRMPADAIPTLCQPSEPPQSAPCASGLDVFWSGAARDEDGGR
jgi:hypothetical protein